MRWRMLFATAGILLAASFAGDTLACGDKLLVVGRGARFQRGYVAIHPASVLLLDTMRTAGSDLLVPLRRAGHRVDVVHDSDQLRRAIAATNYDVVLADWRSASEVQPLVSAATPSVLFVPVLRGASKTDVETATKLYGCPLEPDKRKVKRSFLEMACGPRVEKLASPMETPARHPSTTLRPVRTSTSRFARWMRITIWLKRRLLEILQSRWSPTTPAKRAFPSKTSAARERKARTGERGYSPTN